MRRYETCTQVDPTYRDAWSNLSLHYRLARKFQEFHALEEQVIDHDTGDLNNFIDNYQSACLTCHKLDPELNLDQPDERFGCQTTIADNHRTTVAPNKLKKCEHCSVAMFCNSECQRIAHGSFHGREICAKLKSTRKMVKRKGYSERKAAEAMRASGAPDCATQ